MAILSDYTAGTITVAANGTAVTGVSTGWATAGFREGDWFIANGFFSIIASVNSNTSLTLAMPWQGGALVGAPYRLRYMSDGSRSTAQARELINLLSGSGNLLALAGVTSAPNTRPVFTGAGTMGVVPDTPFARALTALTGANGKFPVATGASSAAMRDIVGTVLQSSGVPTGAIIEQGSNANGEYVRFADGTQICRRVNFGATVTTIAVSSLFTTADISWTYPVPFVSTPSVSWSTRRTSAGTGAPWIGGAVASNGTNSAFTRLISTANNIEGDLTSLAIGRWF